MNTGTRTIKVELAIIGSGLAGCAAGIFARNHGISTALAGNTGAIAYTTGYLDLLGYLPISGVGVLVNPYQGIDRLRQVQPQHPLARIEPGDILTAFKEFTAFLAAHGITYSAPEEKNSFALTPAGTIKPTYCLPRTMAAGTVALAEKRSTVIVDFHGLRGFSGRQVCANLQQRWPGLNTRRIEFPGMEHGELYPEVMARALEVLATRQSLAQKLLAVAGDAEVIGLPAILGMHNPDLVLDELQKLVGRPIFEIPTMPPSVAGIRLREMFEQVFPRQGISLIPQQKVQQVEFQSENIRLFLADNFGPIVIEARAVILATGRFLSGGLAAEMDGIVEPLLDLPVWQPASRNDWFEHDYMNPAGHAVHLAGLEVDDDLRLLGADGNPFDKRLYGAGIVLAHQDWIRGRCGAGVAIATAYTAVKKIAEQLKGQKKAVTQDGMDHER